MQLDQARICSIDGCTRQRCADSHVRSHANRHAKSFKRSALLRSDALTPFRTGGPLQTIRTEGREGSGRWHTHPAIVLKTCIGQSRYRPVQRWGPNGGELFTSIAVAGTHSDDAIVLGAARFTNSTDSVAVLACKLSYNNGIGKMPTFLTACSMRSTVESGLRAVVFMLCSYVDDSHDVMSIRQASKSSSTP